MTDYPFNLKIVHPSWHECLHEGLKNLDQHYLTHLASSTDWLPGPDKIFNAFSQPLDNVNYVLFGESPYPRRESANGYAFWDQAVTELWSETGLSKRVNRATSLRNIIKMLLVTEGLLSPTNCSQEAIAAIPKTNLVQTNTEFFASFINHGFLLLNATLVLQQHRPHIDAKAWHEFMAPLLACLVKERPQVTFVLLGNMANTIDKLISNTKVNKVYAEHPYNISFISNQKIQKFFHPFHLLLK